MSDEQNALPRLCAVVGVGAAADLHTVLALAQRGVRVRYFVPDDQEDIDLGPLAGYYGIDTSGVDQMAVDITSTETMTQLLNGCEQMFLMPGFLPFATRTLERMWLIHNAGTFSLCQAALAAGVKRVVLCGSVMVLGHGTKEKPAGIDTPYQSDDARTPYERSLFRQEMTVWQAAERGLTVDVVCAGWSIGPGGRKDLCNILGSKLNNGNHFFPPMTSAYIDARDLAATLIRTAETPSTSRRLMAPGHNARLIDIVRRRAKHMGIKRRLFASPRLITIAQAVMPECLGGSRALSLNSTKILHKEEFYDFGNEDIFSHMTLHSLNDAAANCADFSKWKKENEKK